MSPSVIEVSGLHKWFGRTHALDGLDQRALDISPFAHVPTLPGADTSAAPFVGLTLVAAAVAAAGLAGVRRRDIG